MAVVADLCYHIHDKTYFNKIKLLDPEAGIDCCMYIKSCVYFSVCSSLFFLAVEVVSAFP